MPTMTCSAEALARPAPRNAGSSAARVPTMAHRAPASSTASTCAISRSPPPTSTGIAHRLRSWRAPARSAAGRPAKAPSRSTTCSRRAPASCQRRAIATGSSEKTVSASARPCTQPHAAAALQIDRRDDLEHRLAASGDRGRSPRSSPAGGCPSAGSSPGGTGSRTACPRPTAAGKRDRRSRRSPPGRAWSVGLRVVRVHEVEVAPRSAMPSKSGRSPPVLDLVPAHVRHLEAVGGKRRTAPGITSRPLPWPNSSLSVNSSW